MACLEKPLIFDGFPAEIKKTYIFLYKYTNIYIFDFRRKIINFLKTFILKNGLF